MASVTAVDVVEAAGVPPTPHAVELADAYLSRTRRGRRAGAVIGVLAGFGPLAGERGLSLLVPRLLAGYLLGLLLSELVVRRPAGDRVRVASLRPRSVADLLPRIGRVLPWLTLTPVLAAPALAIGWHPRGRSHAASALGSCSATAYWPRTATLFVVAGIAIVAGCATVSVLRRLSHRPQRAGEPTVLDLDRALRARSARSAVGAASALGLALLALVGASVDEGTHSFVCTLPLSDFTTTSNVYSWAPAVTPWLQGLDQALMLAALGVWALCRRLRVPGSARA